ncbi:MAG: hypothetical protein AAFZ05_12415, partial [Pseudomonadota bacterium]
MFSRPPSSVSLAKTVVAAAFIAGGLSFSAERAAATESASADSAKPAASVLAPRPVRTGSVKSDGTPVFGPPAKSAAAPGPSASPNVAPTTPAKPPAKPAPNPSGRMTMATFLDRLMIAESGGRDTAKNPLSTAT